MFRFILNFISLIFCVQVSLAQVLGCTIDDVDVSSIPEGDMFMFNESVSDNVPSDNIQYPTGHSYSLGENTTVKVQGNQYITSGTIVNKLTVYRIKEEIELSYPGDRFYNFTFLVTCDSLVRSLPAVIPIHQTNTFTPTFNKEVYEYYLFSPLYEDLERLLDLNPITVNDNDMSNTEVLFSIQGNSHFDLQYGHVVPASLNKNHSAKLVPKKKTPIVLTETLHLTIYVTDMGYPPKSSNATLIFKPVGTKVPTFKEPYYIGDYYSNNTFIMRSQPELENIPKNYKITAALQGTLYKNYFNVNLDADWKLNFYRVSNLPEIAIYKYNYLIYTLTVTYVDTSSNDFTTKGNATVLVELHNDS